MKLKTCLFVIASVLVAMGTAKAQPPSLFRDPTMSKTAIVFGYAGNLWRVDRTGGEATRLTDGPGRKTNPEFSPDGRWIAFSANTDGNQNVYVMDADGGKPRQLTFGGGPDTVEGWTPDGRAVLFRSPAHSFTVRVDRLYTVPLAGGYPTALPLPMGSDAAYSPDGSHLAYKPIPRWINFAYTETDHAAFWRDYRGGLRGPISVANLADSHVEKLPASDGNDFNPIWAGTTMYFISTRSAPATLFSYDTGTKTVTRVIDNHGMDIMSASGGPGGIVYEQFGSLHIYDYASKSEHQIRVDVHATLPQTQPRSENGDAYIQHVSPSADGTAAVVESYGRIFLVNAAGRNRDLTPASGVANRDPALSPNGERVAYFSDRSGVYELEIQNVTNGVTKAIALGDQPSFYYRPVWSPDGEHLVCTDNRLRLWFVDATTGKATPIATDLYLELTGYRGLNPVWSPDGRWIAYTKQLRNHYRALFVYSVASGTSKQLTFGDSDVEYPTFDSNGSTLYFTSSTNLGLGTITFELTSLDHSPTRNVYALNMNDIRDNASDIGQDIVPLPIAPANYVELQAATSGALYLAKAPPNLTDPVQWPSTVLRYDPQTRELSAVLTDVLSFSLTQNRKGLLYQGADGSWNVSSLNAVSAHQKPRAVQVGSVRVDSRANWRQMYHEEWNTVREFFYMTSDRNVNVAAMEQKYQPYVDGLADREDLNYLFQEMLGELPSSHIFVSGGDMPAVKRTPSGMLGADYSIEHDRYRLTRIYGSDTWDPGARAPLTAPGVDVHAGDYILAIDDRQLHGSDNIDRFLLNTVGKTVKVTVARDAAGSDSRVVTVVPVSSEIPLRNYAWISDNMRTVKEMSHGRLAYVYLPDTSADGFNSFNRYFFSQVGCQGVIVDDRFNEGGELPDYIVDMLRRNTLSYISANAGRTYGMPTEVIDGPKVMLINQYGGSGGDLLPYYFHRMDLGKLVGQRTWGGATGMFGYPPLIDGGTFTMPVIGFFADGKWEPENIGAVPDIDVDLDPAVWRDGGDAQLDAAIRSVLDEIKNAPAVSPSAPPFTGTYVPASPPARTTSFTIKR